MLVRNYVLCALWEGINLRCHDDAANKLENTLIFTILRLCWIENRQLYISYEITEKNNQLNDSRKLL